MNSGYTFSSFWISEYNQDSWYTPPITADQTILKSLQTQSDRGLRCT